MAPWIVLMESNTVDSVKHCKYQGFIGASRKARVGISFKEQCPHSKSWEGKQKQ